MLAQTETRPAAGDVLKNWPIEASVPKPSTHVSAAEYREALARVASSVSIVSTDGAEQFDDGWKQHDNAGVEGEDPEGPVRFAGPKMHLLVAKTLHSIQQRTDRLHEFKRFGGRLHMQCDPHEQRVVEIASQPRQRLAQRRLLGAQRLSGAGQASFAKQYIQDAKRVQVEFFAVLFRNSLHNRPGGSLAGSFSLG
jgi:hypothetical protein